MTKKIVYLALFTALVTVFTMFPSISLPLGGYVNLGDTVLTCAVLCMGALGVIPAAIGSALSDLFLGYTVYAPATLVIKAIMGVLLWVVLRKGKQGYFRFLLAVAVAECWMVIGYLLYEGMLYGFAVAAGNILFNGLQAAVTVAVAPLLCRIFQRMPFFKWPKE